MSASTIRSPAVAGMFYPRDRNQLGRMVDDLLGRVPPPRESARLCALVSPHAGYVYSGAVAAHGFRLLAAGTSAPRVVVVIGPSHVEAFSFTSVFDGTAYRTPLGDVAVDISAARAIADAHPSIRLSHHGHVQPHLARGEHGIEVQLPFLQRALGECAIVPIVMGAQDHASCVALGEAIAAACDPGETLVIASSDLSHFYPDREADRLDTVFCATLETLDAEALSAAVSRGECEACGAGPVVASLLATEPSGERRCVVLARAHSGDVSGDRSSVVGYASAAVFVEAAS